MAIHIPGATGPRAEVLRRYPKARLIKVGPGVKYPIYAVMVGKVELGRAEGSSAAWIVASQSVEEASQPARAAVQ